MWDDGERLEMEKRGTEKGIAIGGGGFHDGGIGYWVEEDPQSLGAAPVIVKEGSIGSLLVKIPWKVTNCQIEVEEAELVLAPRVGDTLPENTDKLSSGQDGQQSDQTGREDIEHDADHSNVASSSLDVHEGVKTIAKMVKWLLTSLHVRIKSLICAFDPCLEKGEKISRPQRIAILRIPETVFGTCVSEDVDPTSDSGADGFLGSSRLTNFIKFQGAMFELLEMDYVSNQSSNPTASGTTFNDRYAGSLPSGAAIPILTGDGGGFSGMLKFSIPWKNGSLDIRKVDTDVSIEPIELRLQPDTINWIIRLGECLENENVDGRTDLHEKGIDVACITSTSCHQYFTGGSAVKDVGRGTSSTEKSSVFCSPTTQETVADALLPGTHIIPYWVPYSSNRNEKDNIAAEDYEASVDQFFECFDGMRSSQSALGNTGIWNWTSSVFSAITAASSLASGSVHISSGQQNVETNIRVAIVGISVILSFCDEDKAQPHDSKCNNRNKRNLEELKSRSFSTHDMAIPLLHRHSAGSMMETSCSMNVKQPTMKESTSFGQNIHYLEAQFLDLVLNLQVCPEKSKFEAMLMRIEVDECYSYGQRSFIESDESAQSQMLLVQHLQEVVQGVLPPFPVSAQDLSSEEPRKEYSSTVEDPVCTKSLNGNVKGIIHKTLCKPNIVSIKLLRTLGESGCHFAASSSYLHDGPRASTSFSARLPSFILWVNFNLIDILLDLCKKVGCSSKISYSDKDDSIYGGLSEKQDSSCHRGSKRGSNIYNVKDVSSYGGVDGFISLSHSRFVLCFPYQNHGDSRQHFAWEEFICIDFSPSLCLKAFPDMTSQKGYPYADASSIHLNFGDLNVYFVSSADKNYEINNNCAINHQTGTIPGTLFAEKILSVTQDKGECSVISISWQAGCVTGPWIAKKAWHFASAQDSRSRNKVMGKGYEFASVTTAKDIGEANSCVRQEMILSSTFILQIHVSLVSIFLGASEYKLLNRLLNQIVDGFAWVANDAEANADDSLITAQASPGDGCVSQLSVLIEFDALDFFIRLEKAFKLERGDSLKQSMQEELLGSWVTFRLTVEKFGLLSVSNIGGITGTNCVWLSHGEGELWGCLNAPDADASFTAKDFLLISCKSTTMQRGGGEGTNTMMFGSAGSNIMHMWDPQLLQSFFSVTVRCGTVIAPGGRLDWLNEIYCFFSLLAEVNEQSGGRDMQEESSEDHVPCGSSFFLDLVDIALSYEPHCRNSTFDDKVSESECCTSANPVEESGELLVACLLAAASLNLSNKSLANSTSNDFRITLHDVGLLLSTPWSENAEGMHSVEYLRSIGYVKVAGEALVEAILRTNFGSGLLWELECPDCHIDLDTCHDTTAGLIRLVDQLQQLFAPDIEESIVHLQNRWDDVQTAHGCDATAVKQVLNSCSASPTSSFQASSIDVEGRSIGVGLMDKIPKDAFFLNRNHICSSGSCEMQADIAQEGYLPEQECNLIVRSLTSVDSFGLNASNGSVCEVDFKNFPSTLPIGRAYSIEGYDASELHPLLKSSDNFQLLNKADVCMSNDPAFVDFEGNRGGWYRNGSLQIIENHVSNVSEKGAGKQLREEENLPSSSLVISSDLYKPRAKILLKNIDVRWRMHAGSDWPESRKKVPSALHTAGRDDTVCLEITLFGMDVQYVMFPDGEVHVSNISLSVQDFHLHDCSRDAPWKMVLGCYNSKEHPRESSAKALKVDLECVRPDPAIPLEEYRLQLAFLPIRVHLDQEQLNFLISFFTRNDPLNDSSQNDPSDTSGSRSTENWSLGRQAIAREALLPFFQKCDIWPGVVRVDYIPRHINLAALRGGNYAELLNVVPWKGIELQLKDVHAVDIYGWSNVCETVIGEWLEDISQNQVHKLLKGLAPIRSLVAVGSGAAKLVSLPVKSYRKDHRLLKGMQRDSPLKFLTSMTHGYEYRYRGAYQVPSKPIRYGYRTK
ncbi:hypothetical protein ACLOJK_013690 [Asimina triloba]